MVFCQLSYSNPLTDSERLQRIDTTLERVEARLNDGDFSIPHKQVLSLQNVFSKEEEEKEEGWHTFIIGPCENAINQGRKLNEWEPSEDDIQNGLTDEDIRMQEQNDEAIAREESIQEVVDSFEMIGKGAAEEEMDTFEKLG